MACRSHSSKSDFSDCDWEWNCQSRTEEVVASILADELKDKEVAYAIVNEVGQAFTVRAAAGREELPELDPTIRSAISIGRRLLILCQSWSRFRRSI